ncbi:unnamed protein product (macronuclear) [Paramecium tetraurelia]|uniref:Chromosome undetermined scaffold_1, whole genome shotgun sequence n=1 Tax=Paramecium tetraurelia TaxID=5888 RepID=Q6BFB2_PARTE|nr:Protein required for meiotic chromosome segregation-like transmembrane protein [Paramecium [Paramecium tetraurelia strain d4-2]XP_001422970.1 uncharacterized protein GSPATT00000007001 [Paramecium tetraurelia]CAH03659.1 Protein required for meiotic chromosome segregation-like transmembrane protein, putative [Paramecium tetraurelia]CAK55572.1 unnamed protein product [Paramecium tetraurelia]|eukprot:XP_001422970.1 hypothetical protein (macronuclear) [Paramecium tetraurelia strain d4-2]
MYKITQTQLLEWVKDGNAQTLAVYFRENLAGNQQGLQHFFKMIDNQKRNVVHWAAYFGQLELVENWLQSYSQYIDLNKTDMHHYTPLELASIKGFMKEQDSLIQFSLIKLLIENKAVVRLDNPYQRATPLHWAYYYGNTELIKFLLSNYPDLQYQFDQFGMYPVDYLFLENRPQEYQRNYKGIFIATVVEYAQTVYNHQFKNLRNLNTQMTMTLRSQSLKSQGNDSRDRLQLKEPANEIDSESEERTQNYLHAGLTTMTLMSKVRQTCTMSQKRDSLTSRLSQQFKQIKERMTKLPNKNIPNEIPFDDSQQELNEPEAEKIPTVKIMQPTNTIFIDPHKNYFDQSNKILNSKSDLESERNQQKNLVQSDEEIPRIFKSNNIYSRSELSRYQPSQCQQSCAPSQFGRQLSQEMQISQEDFRLSMKDAQQFRSMKPSLKKPGQKLFKRKSTTFNNEPYYIFHYTKSQNKRQLFECRLQFWSTRIESIEFFTYFLKKGCNPFLIQYQGFNCLHIAANKGKYNILRFILENEYKYKELEELKEKQPYITEEELTKTQQSKVIFNKNNAFNMMTDLNPSNALHLAIEINNYECMKILVENGVSVDVLNHRCLKPFELTFDTKMVKFYENQYLKKNEQSFNFMGYMYVLQTKGSLDVNQDIVMLQLQNIRQSLQQNDMDFEFIVINTPNYNCLRNQQENKMKHHYYVLKLTANTIYKLADKYEIECYHFTKKHLAKFKYRDYDHYEFPKPLQIQSLIVNTLNEEFDLDKFILEGLVISHFPLEDNSKQQKVDQLWKELQYNCIRDTIRFETHQFSLRPLNSIAAYYGPVIAWYISFNVQIVGWLIIPALVGSAIQLYQLFADKVHASILPAYALFMSLWATLFMEKWKNRESEFKYIWDMHKFKQQEPQRVMYTGEYVINQCTNKIGIYDYFTTFKRRLIVEFPVILLGISIIVVSFFAFNIWQSNQDPNNIYMPIIINSLNGVGMTVFCDLYKRLCKSVVNWENHKFDLAMQYSYVLKVFLFEFLISYISVVYAVLFKSDQTQLTLSVASIIITRGLISNLTSNCMPFLFYKYLKWGLEGQFDKFQDYCKDFKICELQYVNDKLPLQDQIKFMQIMEDSHNKQPQKELYNEYTSIAIQFGYTTMFSPAFAAAPLFFLLNQYINLQFSIYNYQNVLKRERAQAADSIGIWLSIFEIMNYCSTFMNCIVIGIVNKSEFEKLIGDTDPLFQTLVLAAIEHILLLIKYILGAAIPDCPYWVSKELRKYAFLEGKSAKIQEDSQNTF